jgi:DNA-binding FadR family transcriptional regulator
MHDSLSPLNLGPVQKTTLVESVMEQILSLMVEGQLAVGDRLPSERTLMKMMSVGRSTVREALQGLSAMNLIETRSGQGSTIKSLPPVILQSGQGSITAALERELRLQLLEMRELIEGTVATWAVQRATDAEVAAVKRHFDDYLHFFSRDDQTRQTQSHRAFHQALAAASHNSIAVSVVDSLVSTIPISLSAKYRQYLPQELEIHRNIYLALSARDEEALYAAIREHMDAERR